MKSRFGFTLIELIIVIVILGIIASVTLPKFVNFKTRAIEKTEDYIAGALNVAVKTNYLSYVTAGGDPSAAPDVNPFTLINTPPPYREKEDYATTYTQDNINWQYKRAADAGNKAYYILCPHNDGNYYGLFATKGNAYYYQYGSAPWNHQPSDFWKSEIYSPGH